MFKSPLTAVIAVCFVALPLAVSAHDYRVGVLKIGDPWIRPNPPGAPTAAGYLRITNAGRQADVMLGGSTSMADRIEIHQLTMADGVMRMRGVSAGLQIAPGQMVMLGPNGYHLMLIHPKRAFKVGEQIAATLHFRRAGAAKINFVVLAARPAGGQSDATAVH